MHVASRNDSAAIEAETYVNISLIFCKIDGNFVTMGGTCTSH